MPSRYRKKTPEEAVPTAAPGSEADLLTKADIARPGFYDTAKTPYLLSSLSYEARTILLDAIARRPRKETAARLGLTQGRLSQIVAELRTSCPLAYYIITGKHS